MVESNIRDIPSMSYHQNAIHKTYLTQPIPPSPRQDSQQLPSGSQVPPLVQQAGRQSSPQIAIQGAVIIALQQQQKNRRQRPKAVQ